MVEEVQVIGFRCVECCGQGASFGRKSNVLQALEVKARIANEHQCKQWRYLGARSGQEQCEDTDSNLVCDIS